MEDKFFTISLFLVLVVVWKAKKVPAADTITDQNDLYVIGAPTVPKVKSQSTDLHFRAKYGLGSFNWRYVFKFKLPIKAPQHAYLKLQFWDQDFFSFDDMIGETTLDLFHLYRMAYKTKERVVLRKGI